MPKFLQYLTQSANRFINSRITPSDERRFGLNNTYVFFSRQGALFALMLITTFVAGVNYGNNLILGLTFYLIGIWLVAIVVTFVQISSLSLTVSPPTITQAGSLLWVTLTLTNHQGRAARQIQVSFDNPQDDTHQLSPSDLVWYQKHKAAIIPAISDRVSVRLPVIANRRGQITLPRIQIKSQYPLGIIQAWGYARPRTTGLAYPKPLPIDINRLTQSNHGDEQSHHQQKGQDDFDKLDNYLLGESLARVSWRHLSYGTMLSKHFADTLGQTTYLDYQHMPSQNHEEKLAMLSFLVLAMQQTDTPFALNLPSAQGHFGHGEAFIQHCLMRLANEP